MSCGLGAVILVLMLVDFDERDSTPETALLRADLARLRSAGEELRRALASASGDSARSQREIDALSGRIGELRTETAGRDAELARRRRELAALREAVESAEVPRAPDAIEQPGAGEEHYLIGLNVEGPKIGILVDRSASMSDEKLIDVIRRKNGSEAAKRRGPKWQRTQRTVRWLLARLPEDSQVSVVAFGAKAGPLGGAGWKASRDAKALGAILRELDELVPTGATNLQAGLDALNAEKPSNVYLVTDGLPTQAVPRSGLRRLLSRCGRSNKVSGECRLRLFRHTIRSSAPPAGVPVNVVLLPIEGDPGAADAFWRWTGATGGLTISPSPSWP